MKTGFVVALMAVVCMGLPLAAVALCLAVVMLQIAAPNTDETPVATNANPGIPPPNAATVERPRPAHAVVMPRFVPRAMWRQDPRAGGKKPRAPRLADPDLQATTLMPLPGKREPQAEEAVFTEAEDTLDPDTLAQTSAGESDHGHTPEPI